MTHKKTLKEQVGSDTQCLKRDVFLSAESNKKVSRKICPLYVSSFMNQISLGDNHNRHDD